MRAIDFALTQILPQDMHQASYDVTKKGLSGMMTQLARQYPERYAELSKKVGDLGRNNAYFSGFTTGMSDMDPVIDTQSYMDRMDAELDALKKEKLDPQDFKRERDQILLKYSDTISKDTMSAALKNRNSFAAAVASGARGNATHLSAILSTPGTFMDAKGNLIPLMVRNSYASGVRPAEILAGTYGARSSVISTKTATAKGGDFSKILSQSLSNFPITENDCGTTNGIDLSSDDKSLRGRVLASGSGNVDAGSVLDRSNLAVIKRTGKPVLVRSAMTCQAEDGICAKCAGLQADGKFPKVGDSYGLTAGTAIGEPITQGALNVKHNAGAAKGKKDFAGFEYISQFAQIPDEFKDRAAVAEKDGVIEKIEPAPQGGTYVTVEGEKHFVQPGLEITSKVGQKVEAGDQLSDGLVNPDDVVRLKGLGAGRRYYAERLGKILEDSGMPADPKNIEVIAKANVGQYRIDDPDEDSPYGPDELVLENKFLKGYKPPADTIDTPIDNAGGYLQAPALHYTVGDRVTPSMIGRLKDAGISTVKTSISKPWFTPEMQRLRTVSHSNRDWMASMATSYVKKQLIESAERGDDTNVQENTHWAPRLAFGVGFGEGRDKGKF